MNIKVYPLVIYFLLLASSSFAQDVNLGSIQQSTIAQKLVFEQLNQIIKENKSVDSLVVEFKKNKANYLEVYSRSPIDTIEYYDLNFLGDQYLLGRKYKNLLASILNIKTDDFAVPHENTQSDRICFYVNKLGSTYEYLKAPVPNYATYFDIGYLRDKLNAFCGKDYRVPPGDSVLIIQCILNRDRTLGDIGIIEGRHSSFYNFALRTLRQTGDLWNPMTNNGKPVRSLVDIYIKLDQFNNSTVSITGRGRKLQIWDNDESTPIFL